MAWGALVPAAVGAAKSLFSKKAKDVAKKVARKAISAGIAVGGGTAIIKATSTALGGGPDRPFHTGGRTVDLFGGVGGPGGFKAFGHLFRGGAGRIQPGDNGACPQGYHLNKTKTSDGLEPRSICVRNRKINFANGRAAGRAGRRLRGTVKMLRKSFSLVSGKTPRGKFIPKKRR